MSRDGTPSGSRTSWATQYRREPAETQDQRGPSRTTIDEARAGRGRGARGHEDEDAAGHDVGEPRLESRLDGVVGFEAGEAGQGETRDPEALEDRGPGVPFFGGSPAKVDWVGREHDGAEALVGQRRPERGRSRGMKGQHTGPLDERELAVRAAPERPHRVFAAEQRARVDERVGGRVLEDDAGLGVAPERAGEAIDGRAQGGHESGCPGLGELGRVGCRAVLRVFAAGREQAREDCKGTWLKTREGPSGHRVEHA
jgi:hypothetical protein